MCSRSVHRVAPCLVHRVSRDPASGARRRGDARRCRSRWCQRRAAGTRGSPGRAGSMTGCSGSSRLQAASDEPESPRVARFRRSQARGRRARRVRAGLAVDEPDGAGDWGRAGRMVAPRRCASRASGVGAGRRRRRRARVGRSLRARRFALRLRCHADGGKCLFEEDSCRGARWADDQRGRCQFARAERALASYVASRGRTNSSSCSLSGWAVSWSRLVAGARRRARTFRRGRGRARRRRSRVRSRGPGSGDGRSRKHR